MLSKVDTASVRIRKETTRSSNRIIDTRTIHEWNDSRMLYRSSDIDH
jgi:hypothetical protein